MIDYIPAQPAFAEPAALLLNDTMDPFADIALGLGDHAFCLRLLAELYTKEGNRFSHDRAVLALQGGNVAALLLAFPGSELAGRNRAFLSQSFRIYGLRNYLRLLSNFLQTFTGKETEKDEFYIAHLAVTPAYRGQGIGRALLAQAQDRAVQTGFHKVSLLVEIGNTPAISLYEGAGFVITSTEATPHLEKRFHTPGYHHMLKNI